MAPPPHQGQHWFCIHLRGSQGGPGPFAAKDVTAPASNTGTGPGKMSFQALGIPTKVVHGTAEIVSDVEAVTSGSACRDIGSDALGYAEC